MSLSCMKLEMYTFSRVIFFSPGGGVLDISLGVEVRPGPLYPDPVKTKIADFPTLFKTEFQFSYPV